jgi:hypothetical protein
MPIFCQPQKNLLLSATPEKGDRETAVVITTSHAMCFVVSIEFGWNSGLKAATIAVFMSYIGWGPQTQTSP